MPSSTVHMPPPDQRQLLLDALNASAPVGDVPAVLGRARRAEVREIRAWLRANGHLVGKRGRLSSADLAAYEEARIDGGAR